MQRLLITFLLLFTLLFPLVVPTAAYTETAQDKQKLFKVTGIIDGDTIVVTIRGTTEKVRLIGIDTPETKDPRKAVQCFGTEATNKMRSLVNGKYIKLVDDRTQGNRDGIVKLSHF